MTTPSSAPSGTPAESVEQMLAVHRATWDMPTLAATHPEVIEHLSARYAVHFGIASDVIVEYKDTGATEAFGTTDVRVAVETLLAREVAER